MPFEDQEVTTKIHLNYRLVYLKDTALATGLDEGNLQVIGNLINNNNAEVIQSILLDQNSISKVFDKLKDENIETRKESINFLSEIFNISKNLQVQGRLNLLTSFKNIEEFNLSIFVRECISFKSDVDKSEDSDQTKRDEAEKLVTNSLDVFQNYMQTFPISLSDLCSENKKTDESDKLLKSLTEELLNCTSQGLKLQIHELLKFLLESDNNIFATFYDISFKAFAAYLILEPKENDREFNDNMDFTKCLAVDIINKSLVDDNFNSRQYMLKYNLINSINTLAKFESKLCNMSVIKFYKSLLLTGYKPYSSEMIKENLLDSVVNIFDKIVNKRNMIASIVLELFHIIDKKNLHELAKHLCDKHEIVKPFLQKWADTIQPKVPFSSSVLILYRSSKRMMKTSSSTSMKTL